MIQQRAESESPEERGSEQRVSLIAHRGYAGVFPENTVAAFRRSLDADGPRRPDCIEFDVMPTGDGEVVVHHDQTLARVTDAPPDIGDRHIWELPYDTIREFDVLGSGSAVPTLESVLEAIPADVRLNVELKNPGSTDLRTVENLDGDASRRQRERWDGFVERTFDVLDGYSHDLLVSSFFEGALAASRAVDPSIPIAVIFNDSVQDGLAVARRYDADAVHLPLNMVPGTAFSGTEYRGVGPFEGIDDRDLLSVAREEGREVNAWTATTWYEAAEVREAGVDGIITDYPGLFHFEGATDRETGQA
ncbi:glycerophosphodiester phosphodiesterase [Haloarcula onubensis]|uniref:Glycerophosphodiester phosphodiesterase n=1 Tax=Haloarcula onubensis TaxID=2950539 RepID=A0ABU2FQM5_9EURY|nr:glycerophosphodiester phosphodiesterase [Halomicroarcula sp. S3CR25-11]MDS0283044.1 glycerophosphodiester phosphodiesterase [Halomicroarcula sp. S3CR25-11]